LETDGQKAIDVRRLVGNESCVRRRRKKRRSDVHWRNGGVVLEFIERWRKWGTGEAKVGGKVRTFN
jgi:hypothetical protein